MVIYTFSNIKKVYHILPNNKILTRQKDTFTSVKIVCYNHLCCYALLFSGLTDCERTDLGQETLSRIAVICFNSRAFIILFDIFLFSSICATGTVSINDTL